MKQQDIAILIVVVFVSGILAFVVSGKVISPKSHHQDVESVPVISSTFNNQAVSQYITSNSVDPAQLIQIGPGSNQSPFVQSNQ